MVKEIGTYSQIIILLKETTMGMGYFFSNVNDHHGDGIWQRYTGLTEVNQRTEPETWNWVEWESVQIPELIINRFVLFVLSSRFSFPSPCLGKSKVKSYNGF